jgi:hypothetical protein
MQGQHLSAAQAFICPPEALEYILKVRPNRVWHDSWRNLLKEWRNYGEMMAKLLESRHIVGAIAP